MPKPRQDFAIVEWEFIRFDRRYRALQSYGHEYLHLWATCIHLRRWRFSKGAIGGIYVPDVAGVNPERFVEMVERAVASGLFSRGPGGIISVDGIKTKHPALRSWNDDPLIEHCGNLLSEDRRGEDRTGSERTGSERESEIHPSSDHKG